MRSAETSYSFEPKLRRRVVRYETERLMREKRSEEMDALEEVFDRATLMAVYRMLNRGPLLKIFGAVKAGKESRIYWGLDKNGEVVAVKIYLTASSTFQKRGRSTYVKGDLSFGRTKRDSRSVVKAWAVKEYFNLIRAKKAGVSVPTPVRLDENVLVMEFIGKDGEPAPELRDAALSNPQATYKRILKILTLLYRDAKLVHGDLSEYNIMMRGSAPVLFDFAQAVTSVHPMALPLLTRDLTNLNSYFGKLGVQVVPVNDLIKRMTSTLT